MSDMDTVHEIVNRLARLGYARNREIDRETRTIEITDDEAVLLIEVLALSYELGQ